jgi:hypothetical protein
MLPNDHTSDKSILPPNGEAIFDRIDDIKRERNIPVEQNMTAIELIEKHRDVIVFIHQAGRPQRDVYIYLEIEEGKLKHADDTLRKAINKVVKNWRNRAAPKATAVTIVKPAPFADTFNTGGNKW